MEFSWLIFIASMMSVTLGAVLQASTGLGAGLIIVPLLALINLEFIPGPIIFASMVLSFLMAWRGRAYIKFTNMPILLVALLIGMALGAYSLSWFAKEDLGVIFGIIILLAVAVSFRGVNVKHTPITLMTSGFLSGLMGAMTSIGAPVLALLYQREDVKILRATLGFLYFFSSMIMLLLLHLAGYFASSHVLMGFWLMPGFILGYWVSGRVSAWLDRGYSRLAVLIISSLSAIVLIVKS